MVPSILHACLKWNSQTTRFTQNETKIISLYFFFGLLFHPPVLTLTPSPYGTPHAISGTAGYCLMTLGGRHNRQPHMSRGESQERGLVAISAGLRQKERREDSAPSKQ